MRAKLIRALGSLAAILLLSGVISIFEYRRMSDYVSELISSNIKSINLSQRLSDITQEYDQQMLAVVVTNDISLMPDFDPDMFVAQADSLKNSIKSTDALEMVDSVVSSFNAFMKTSLQFDEVFLADNVNTGEWFLERSSLVTASSAMTLIHLMKPFIRISRPILPILMRDSTEVSSRA